VQKEKPLKKELLPDPDSSPRWRTVAFLVACVSFLEMKMINFTTALAECLTPPEVTVFI
jgi:hypothetical protein